MNKKTKAHKISRRRRHRRRRRSSLGKTDFICCRWRIYIPTINQLETSSYLKFKYKMKKNRAKWCIRQQCKCYAQMLFPKAKIDFLRIKKKGSDIYDGV